MPTILCQLMALLRYLSTPTNDPNLRACRVALQQAVDALERHIQAGSVR